MEYFKLSFESAPCDEGEGTKYVKRQACDKCGVHAVPISESYFVPEDGVEALALESYDSDLPGIFEAAGMLIARTQFAEAIARERITGFKLRPVHILDASNDVPISGYSWLVVTGRCESNPVWRRTVRVCPQCQMETTEPVQAATRRVTILNPKPVEDVFRSREQLAGIMVSDAARIAIVSLFPDHSNEISFSPLAQE
ncbi:MAG: hypothetical protein HQ518_02090 [Rhodopirellula sp.]|nr:hypothetical protein [Rhodopirellula sp.]